MIRLPVPSAFALPLAGLLGFSAQTLADHAVRKVLSASTSVCQLTLCSKRKFAQVQNLNQQGGIRTVAFDQFCEAQESGPANRYE
jgi:hypothetical protein